MSCDYHSGEFDECDCIEDDNRIPDQEEIDDYTREDRKCVHPQGCDWCSWCGEPQKLNKEQSLKGAIAVDFNSSAS